MEIFAENMYIPLRDIGEYRELMKEYPQYVPRALDTLTSFYETFESGESVDTSSRRLYYGSTPLTPTHSRGCPNP